MKKFIPVVLVALIAGYLGSYLFYVQHQTTTRADANNQPVNLSQEDTFTVPQNVSISSLPGGITEDFVEASRISTESVVYIKNISERYYRQSFMDMFFGMGGQSTETVSSGSGVIFSPDGYIVTNNHVAADADRLEVIHGKTVYEAKLVGTDPSSDLAVLKIDAKNLPAIPIGKSSTLKVGEGVIAVGNPFNLTSTVTAGIVSAKGRSLNIVKEKFPIESFIQTDAAINPGNSGGALVNRQGELVGINTAILSRTGSYAGYGFAVPVDIVKKIVGDLIHYGEVQKALLGATVTDLNDDVVKRLSLNVANLEGVLVTSVQKGWAADKAGLKENDVILKLDGQPVGSKAEYEELLSYHSPGDKLDIEWKTGEKMKQNTVVLTNRNGTTDIIKTEIFNSEYLGADLEIVAKLELDLYNIDHGVKINKLYAGGLLSRLDIEEGFIITDINDEKIDTAQKLVDALSHAYGRVRIEGVSKSGRKGYYSFYLR